MPIRDSGNHRAVPPASTDSRSDTTTKAWGKKEQKEREKGRDNWFRSVRRKRKLVSASDLYGCADVENGALYLFGLVRAG